MKVKGIILVLVLLGLILIPASVNAQELTCWPPEKWQKEYWRWVAWQQDLQQQFTAETGHGLGYLLPFSQWAKMRAVNHPYWWKSAKRAHSHLFCDSNGERTIKSWE